MIKDIIIDLEHLFAYYNRILGYKPGVADKFLIKMYAQNYEFLPFEHNTIIECFLKEYYNVSKGLENIPPELWVLPTSFI